MQKLPDNLLATRMLTAHKDGGYRFLPFVRMNAKACLFLAIYFGIVIGFLAYAGLWTAVASVGCLLCGVLLRDVGWVIGVNRTWPFVERVTNWEEVQRLAGEK